MTVGAVEYAVFRFPRNDFGGDVAPALAALVRDGTIRILDLVFITRDGDRVDVVEYEDVEAFASSDLDGEVGGLIGLEDIDYVADGLGPDTSVAVLVWEDLWGARLFEALSGAGGAIIERGGIPPDLIDDAMQALASSTVGHAAH